MFSISNCLFKRKNILKAISNEINGVSFLHMCKHHSSLNERKLLSILNYSRKSGFEFNNHYYNVRLISTNDVGTQITTIEINNNSSTDSTLLSSNKIDNVLQSSTIESPKNHESLLNTSNALISQESDTVVELPPIPEPPLPPPKMIDLANALVDPPFEKLGLGGWSPVGWVQNAFEYLHVDLGLPWWECILIGTLFVRSILFPLMVLSQRNNAKMHNYQPKFQELQLKMNEAKQRGEDLEAARYTQDMVLFMKEKGLNPLKNALIPLVQAPIFISFFMGIREMANIPLKSMHNGGLLWFTDLTVPDQYYLLPIITSATLWLTIEIGTDSSKMTNPNQFAVKYILRGIPIVMLPFTISFPAAILLYWTSTNMISLIQVSLFQIPRVRHFLKIPLKVQHTQDKLLFKQKGFLQAIKDWWKETQQAGQHVDRAKKSQLSFNQAGRGAVPKTFKYNPTLPRPSESVAKIQAKKL